MQEEPNARHTPEQIVDVDTIKNLDTARMTLRWALERLHKETDQKHELETKLSAAEKGLKKAADDRAALERTLALRSTDADERELYYKRLEEFLALKLEGKVDLAALAHRELEVDQLKRLLDQKLTQADKEVAARRAALERENRATTQENERALRQRQRAVEQSHAVKSHELEQQHLSKMSELHEKELTLRQEQKALSERQAHFEQYYAEQRAEMHAQLKHHRDEIEAQVRLRVELSERALEERQQSLETAWARERSMLARELQLWKGKAQDLAPLVIELENKLTVADQAALQARTALDAKALVAEEQRQGFEQALTQQQQRLDSQASIWEKQRAVLSLESEDWRRRYEAAVAEGRALAQKLSRVEEQAAELQAHSERESVIFELRLADAQKRIEEVSLELEAWKQKYQASLGLTQSLANQLAASQDGVELQRGAASREAAKSEQRLKLAHKRVEDVSRELEAFQQQQYASQALIAGLESKLAAADSALLEAKMEAQSQEERFKAQRQSWDQTRQSLSTELAGQRQESAQSLARLLELDRRLASADEAKTAQERAFQRFEDNRQAWDKERRTLEAELAQWRLKHQEAIERVLGLERAATALKATAPVELPPLPDVRKP